VRTHRAALLGRRGTGRERRPRQHGVGHGDDAVIALCWRHADDLQHPWVSAEVARGELQSWGRHSTEEEERWQELRSAANGDPLGRSLCESSRETEGSGEEVRRKGGARLVALVIYQAEQGSGTRQVSGRAASMAKTRGAWSPRPRTGAAR
jgi:hypothetical protein